MGVSTWKASRRGQRRRCGASWAQTKIADRQSKMAENKKCLISAIILRLNVYINTNDTHINTGFNLFSKENSSSVLLSHFFVVPLRPQKIKILNRHIVLKLPFPSQPLPPAPALRHLGVNPRLTGCPVFSFAIYRGIPSPLPVPPFHQEIIKSPNIIRKILRLK